MNTIEINHKHTLSLDQARSLAEELAEELAQEHRLDYEWEDNSLFFSRTGVTGQIDVSHESIDIYAKLNWLLTALRGTIEQEIHNVLGRHFK